MTKWNQDDESRRFWTNVESAAKSVRNWEPERRAAARIAVAPEVEKRAQLPDDRPSSKPTGIGLPVK